MIDTNSQASHDLMLKAVIPMYKKCTWKHNTAAENSFYITGSFVSVIRALLRDNDNLLRLFCKNTHICVYYHASKSCKCMGVNGEALWLHAVYAVFLLQVM